MYFSQINTQFRWLYFWTCQLNRIQIQWKPFKPFLQIGPYEYHISDILYGRLRPQFSCNLHQNMSFSNPWRRHARQAMSQHRKANEAVGRFVATDGDALVFYFRAILKRLVNDVISVIFHVGWELAVVQRWRARAAQTLTCVRVDRASVAAVTRDADIRRGVVLQKGIKR